VKLGLIVRVDNRGLGIQSWELYRHLRPYRTVAVRMSGVPGHDQGREFLDRFPDALHVNYVGGYGHGKLEPYREVRQHLSVCDILLTVETPYDFRLLEDLPRTVVAGNREFLNWVVDPDLLLPTLFVAPSTWRLADWPENTVYLPHPVDRERLPFRERSDIQAFLHLAAEAFRDRAGTDLVSEAVKHVRPQVRITVKAQRQINRRRRVAWLVEDVDDYWKVYQGFDVLVAPRRYGGQSLPVNEALSLGMPVIALDREPERSMLPLESLVPANRARDLKVSGGVVGLWDANPVDLAQRIAQFASDPELVRRLSRDADARASELSWERLLPRWQKLLEEV